jgi:hypothetical protein
MILFASAVAKNAHLACQICNAALHYNPLKSSVYCLCFAATALQGCFQITLALGKQRCQLLPKKLPLKMSPP